MIRLVSRCKKLLTHPKSPVILGVLSAALLFPALGGFQLDDHFQRFRLLGLGDDALQLFVFYTGDADANRAEMEQGYSALVDGP